MMDMFNPCILSAREIISGHTIIPVDTNGELWPIVDKTPFIMERDTKIELGGHPKESVSLILSSSDVDLSDMPELSFNGDPLLMSRESHISYGKVVLLCMSLSPSSKNMLPEHSSEVSSVLARKPFSISFTPHLIKPDFQATQYTN